MVVLNQGRAREDQSQERFVNETFVHPEAREDEVPLARPKVDQRISENQKLKPVPRE